MSMVVMASGLDGVHAVGAVGVALRKEHGIAIILLLKEMKKTAQDLVELMMQKPVTNINVQVKATAYSLKFPLHFRVIRKKLHKQGHN